MIKPKMMSRWTKKGKDLLVSTFDKREELLYNIRDIFYQFPCQPLVFNSEVLSLIKKVFDPQPDQNVPLNFQDDIYKSVDLDNKPPEVAVLHLEALDLVARYYKNRFLVLEGKEPEEKITLEGLKAPGNKDWRTRYVEMKAYIYLSQNGIDKCIDTLK